MRNALLPVIDSYTTVVAAAATLVLTVVARDRVEPLLAVARRRERVGLVDLHPSVVDVVGVLQQSAISRLYVRKTSSARLFACCDYLTSPKRGLREEPVSIPRNPSHSCTVPFLPFVARSFKCSLLYAYLHSLIDGQTGSDAS